MLLYGKIRKSFVKGSDVLLVGSIQVNIAVALKSAIVIGTGRIGVLAGENCYIVSQGGPLIIGALHCINALAIGVRHPIVIHDVKSKHFYARRALAKNIKAEKCVLGEMCIVENLASSDELVFADPHVYLKNLGEVKNMEFAYEPVL